MSKWVYGEAKAGTIPGEGIRDEGIRRRRPSLLSAASELYEAGVKPGTGTFACSQCGDSIALEALDELPDCPRCGSSSFRRASLFASAIDAESHPTETAEFPATGPATALPTKGPATRPVWLAEIRDLLEEGWHLAFAEEGEVTLFPLERGWTRIGRSVTADLRLDDPTVSRRHALVVWEGDEPLRVLDDRSLNGIVLNGEVVEWGTLSDGDELVVGRYNLYVLESH